MTLRQTPTLAQFITDNSDRIIAEWGEFARVYVKAASELDLEQRRDHVAGMLKAIAADLATAQTEHEQANKSKGSDDARVESDIAANAHGTDRASSGFSPVDVISEFRALRASVLRLWTDAKNEFSRANLNEVTRFNEAIDQLLVESMTRYAVDVEHAQDMYLGVLSHDLRNPLGAIMMSATLMMTQAGPDGSHAKTASRILNAGTRMDGLIGDLVDFTRSRLAGGMPITRGETDIEIVCRQTIDEITTFHPRRVVRLETSGDLIGFWDSARVGQVVSNLIGNAIEHGSENEPIEVTLRGDADQVVLTVHNKGHVIPKSKLTQIFDPFKQLEPKRVSSKSSRSIGLGLYIVQSIVAAHRGAIKVDSTDSGTTFTVQLPKLKDEASA